MDGLWDFASVFMQKVKKKKKLLRLIHTKPPFVFISVQFSSLNTTASHYTYKLYMYPKHTPEWNIPIIIEMREGKKDKT